MLKIKDYSDKIDALHQDGKTAIEIARILNLKYHQPVYNYFKKMGWDRLSYKDYPMSTKYQVDKTFFNKIDTEEKAYILGFICADGHINYKNSRIVIGLQQSDVNLLYKIRDCLKSNHPIKENIQKTNPYKHSNNKVLYQCLFRVNGEKLVSPLKKLGLDSNKTYTLNSSIISHIPENLIRHFLRGYFDGDGNVFWGAKYTSGIKYLIQVCGNKDFLLGTFQKYFPTDNKLYKDKKSKQTYTWKVSSKYDVLRFLSYIYSDAKIYLDRKYNIFLYAMWSCKTELIAGNSYFIEILKGQSAANPLVKCLRQVQRLADETIRNPYDSEIEYNSATNAQQSINID